MILLGRDSRRSSSSTSCSEAPNKNHYSTTFASIPAVVSPSILPIWLILVFSFYSDKRSYTAMPWLHSATRLTTWLTFPPLTLSHTCSPKSAFFLWNKVKTHQYLTSKITQISNKIHQIRRNSIYVRLLQDLQVQNSSFTETSLLRKVINECH